MNAQVIYEDSNRMLIHIRTNVVRTVNGGIHKASQRKVRAAALRAARGIGFKGEVETEEIRWDAEPYLTSPIAHPFVARKERVRGSQLVILG